MKVVEDQDHSFAISQDFKEAKEGLTCRTWHILRGVAESGARRGALRRKLGEESQEQAPPGLGERSDVAPDPGL
jgi:hypothetical protein